MVRCGAFILIKLAIAYFMERSEQEATRIA